MRINRAGLVAVFLALIALATLAGTLYLWLWSALTVDQRIAATASSLTAGAFVVAVLAGIIATLAYRQGILRSHLTVTLEVVRTKGNCFCYFTVSNDGKISAAYVILWVILPANMDVQDFTGWTMEGHNSYRWEARAGLVVHPNVPPYTLPRLQCAAYDPSIRVQYTLVADGIKSHSSELTNPATQPKGAPGE